MSVLPNCGGERGILLKIEVYLNNTVFKESLFMPQKTYCASTENNKQLMLFQEITGFSRIHKTSACARRAHTHTHTQCNKNELFLNVKLGGTYHCALKG
jgi:hypothetical protein